MKFYLNAYSTTKAMCHYKYNKWLYHIIISQLGQTIIQNIIIKNNFKQDN